MLPVDDALAQLLRDAGPLGAEDVAIAEASGRVLASAIAARRTQPPFPASAMDGYAVRGQDIETIPAKLNVIGESIAGKRFDGTVGPGEAVRIFTGAPIPNGADTVLLQEDAKGVGNQTIEALEATPKGRHIRREGLDFITGEPLLSAGRLLDPAALSLAAAANHAMLPVVRKPLVAIIATGTELVAPGDNPGPDQIVASNSYGVAAIARNAGAQILDLGIVPDDRAQIAASMDRARAARADIVVTLGGASVGDHDLVRDVLAGQGMQLEFWKIAMRPGKPLMFGRFDDTRVLGLPGNPVSSMVCAYVFLVPLVAALAGRSTANRLRSARLGSPMKANDHRQDYVRAHVEDRDGELTATPFGTQDSSMLKTLAASNALIVREPGAAAAEPGDACRVMLLS
ncbi:gephyrin-like molybdotransferase Glp [Mesorhizobium sp. CAU 1732]|uniref:molybdopterin molybdotransferase MoeA n=1 Tax=Mesorhizobium sp. CAU 1732 TaxID=3140358 RepID=UPI0032609AAA